MFSLRKALGTGGVKKREIIFRVTTSLRMGAFQGIVLSRGHQNLIANFGYAKIDSDVTRLNCLWCCAAITYSKSGNRSHYSVACVIQSKFKHADAVRCL